MTNLNKQSAAFSKELRDMLTEFLICEIGSGATEGITYTLLLKSNKKDMEIYNRYMSIKKEAIKCGFMENDIFRVYEVSNGYILDMDILTAKQITSEMAKAISKCNNEQYIDIIGDMPEQRRKRDMVTLARYLKHEFDSGKNALEVALFSKNSTNRIIINGRGTNGDMISIRYNAYAIRHWDLETINAKLLIPAKFRICRIKPCEILPSKTGVSFIITMEELYTAQ